MSQKEIITTVAELQELRRMQEDLAAEIETMQSRIKDYMDATGAQTLKAGAWKVNYREVTSNRLDAAALRKALPEVAERFTKTTTTRRFTVQ